MISGTPAFNESLGWVPKDKNELGLIHMGGVPNPPGWLKLGAQAWGGKDKLEMLGKAARYGAVATTLFGPGAGAVVASSVPALHLLGKALS